jgi:HAD superfamily hydrolase (TIGR01509 family)
VKVLLYDCDGVLGDTEQYGHLVAFNQMWREFGVPWSWSVEQDGAKLAIGGGKERMASLWDDADFRAAVSAAVELPATRDEYVEIVAGWHKRKSAIYQELIMSGKIPPRPGVKRLAQEALDAGWTLGVCSTSAKPSVEAVLGHVMGDLAERFSLLLAGDMVKAKKPAPDIYNMAAEQLGASPAECLVIEDSRNGLRAAHAAGMKCLVTVSGYTRNEAFSEAALVVTCLGDPGGEQAEVLANRSAARPGAYITAGDLEQILGG